MTTYRVTYPLITRDAHRDFADKDEANRFFYEMRNRTSPYLTMHSWRHVRMVALDTPTEPADNTDHEVLRPVDKFTVSAEWMKACGYGQVARTFNVIRVEYRAAPNPDYRKFYVLDRDGTEWTVLAGRGSPIEL